MSKQLDSLVQPDNSTHQNMQHSGNRKFDNLFGNAPSSSRAAEKRPAGMAPGEDFHPGAKVDDMGAENSSQQGDLTSTQRQTMIKNILDAPNDVKAIRNAWEKSIPGDLVMSYKHLKAAVHPDKFHDVLEKDQAQRAFQRIQWVESEAPRLFSGEVDRNQNFFQGGPSAEEHVEGELHESHKQAHKTATLYLRALFSALKKSPNDRPTAAGCAPDILMPIMMIDKINNDIRTENNRNNRDSDLGTIRYENMIGCWSLAMTEPSLAESQLQNLKSFCAKFRYPDTWARFHEAAPPSISNTPPSISNTPLATQANSAQGQSAQSQPQNTSENALQLHHRYAQGRLRTISLTPRTVTRSVRPGFTSSGEPIRMIQNLGMRGARFVTEDANGKLRLVSSAAAGGQLALDGAISKGIPTTVQKEQDISELRNLVRNTTGGTYGLKWVAIGTVDGSRDKSPFIVVGFYFEGPSGSPSHDIGISKSALKKILSPKEADTLISEAITEEPDVGLRDAIASLSGLALSPGLPAQPSSHGYLAGANLNPYLPMVGEVPNWSSPYVSQQSTYQNSLGIGPVSNGQRMNSPQDYAMVPQFMQHQYQPQVSQFTNYPYQVQRPQITGQPYHHTLPPFIAQSAPQYPGAQQAVLEPTATRQLTVEMEEEL